MEGMASRGRDVRRRVFRGGDGGDGRRRWR